MNQELEGWWHVQEMPFRSDKPMVGPLIVWARNAWNSVATKWYVRPLLEQQNKVNGQLAEKNRRLTGEVEQLRRELHIVQEIAAKLDQEISDVRRLNAQALYSLRQDLDQLRAQEKQA